MAKTTRLNSEELVSLKDKLPNMGSVRKTVPRGLHTQSVPIESVTREAYHHREYHHTDKKPGMGLSYTGENI